MIRKSRITRRIKQLKNVGVRAEYLPDWLCIGIFTDNGNKPVAFRGEEPIYEMIEI